MYTQMRIVGLVYREQRDLPNGTNGFIVVAFAVTIVMILG